MKKQAVLKISGILLALALVATAVCLAVTRGQNSGSSNSTDSVSKKIYEGHPSLAWTSLLERCQRAEYIIAGTVISRGETTLHEGAQPPLYTPIYFQAQKIMKGNPPDGIVEFHEDGGELDSAIYIVDGSNNFQPGERAVVFVRENGYPISGGSEFQLTDGVVILPVEEKLEGLPIPSCQPRDENGWVIFPQQQFIHYLKSLCRFMPS